MNPRRVLITIEMTTDATRKQLEDSYLEYVRIEETIHRVTVKVVKEKKK